MLGKKRTQVCWNFSRVQNLITENFEETNSRHSVRSWEFLIEARTIKYPYCKFCLHYPHLLTWYFSVFIMCVLRIALCLYKCVESCLMTP